jgi:hypothetical protein
MEIVDHPRENCRPTANIRDHWDANAEDENVTEVAKKGCNRFQFICEEISQPRVKSRPKERPDRIVGKK